MTCLLKIERNLMSFVYDYRKKVVYPYIENFSRKILKCSSKM